VLEGEAYWDCDGRRPEHDGAAQWGGSKVGRGNVARLLSRRGAAHQLNLVTQGVISSLCEGTFYTTLTGLVCHLRRQQELVAEMKSTCPIVPSTRWLSLGRVTKWLSKHREAVIRHLDEKALSRAPPPSWWVLLLAVEAFMVPFDACFKRMQGLTLPRHRGGFCFLLSKPSWRPLTLASSECKV
jgi:hypothetical protein